MKYNTTIDPLKKQETTFGESLCEFNLYDLKNNRCDKKTTTDTESSGLVKCDYAKGQQCNYTLASSNTTFVEDCTCGMNSLGHSYCPKSNNGKIQ